MGQQKQTVAKNMQDLSTANHRTVWLINGLRQYVINQQLKNSSTAQKLFNSSTTNLHNNAKIKSLLKPDKLSHFKDEYCLSRIQTEILHGLFPRNVNIIIQHNVVIHPA